jgi:hypothetical protein
MGGESDDGRLLTQYEREREAEGGKGSRVLSDDHSRDIRMFTVSFLSMVGHHRYHDPRLADRNREIYGPRIKGGYADH